MVNGRCTAIDGGLSSNSAIADNVCNKQRLRPAREQAMTFRGFPLHPANPATGWSGQPGAMRWPALGRALARALLLALLAACAGLALAQPEPPRAWPSGDIPGQYWADATGKASLEAARAAFDGGQGRPADPNRLMPLGRGAAVWFRLQMPPVAEPTRAVLTITFSGTDSVELFRPDGAGGWRRQRSGDVIPVNEWPVRELHPTFGFTLQPGEVQPTLMRVVHTHPIRVAWELWDVRSFNTASKGWHLALGAYIGFIALVLLISILNTYSWRDPIHAYYALHVALVGLSILSLTGLAGEYLWPGNAWWNDKAPVVLPSLAMSCAALFVREFVTQRGSRVVSWLLIAMAALSFIMAAAFLVIDRENFYRAPSIYAAPQMAVLLAVLADYSRRRPELGLWVLAGFGMLVLGSLLPMSRSLGWVPSSFVTEYGIQIGGALEIPLVLVGIYFRSRERRDNRQRMGALAHTDPLTGVANHRVLVDKITGLSGRGRRSPFEGALLQVHVANLEAIREQYGREAAEAAMVRAAQCVTRETRMGDIVAREQGGDLVVLLDGKVSRELATECGRNIIARALKFSRRLPSGVTLTLRIAGVLAPLPPGNAAVLLGNLARVILELDHDPLGRAMHITGSDDKTQPRRSYRGAIVSGVGPP
jgi:two-component system, sensor histidine kinase LadS